MQPRGARRHGDTAAANHTSQGGAGTQGDTTAGGTRKPRGARRRATTNRTSQGDAGHRSDTAARTSRSGGAERRGTVNGARQPRGAHLCNDTAAANHTSQGGAGTQGQAGAANGTWQPRGAPRQRHTAASNRTCFSGCAGRYSDTTASRRRSNHTSRPGCAGPTASGTGGTGKTSLPAVHQKDPCHSAAKEKGRHDRRISGLHLPATLASKSDPRFKATSHDRRRVALGSPSPLPADAILQQ